MLQYVDLYVIYYVQDLHCLIVCAMLGVFHAEWENARKAGSPDTEGWVLPDCWYVEQRREGSC